MYMKKSLVLLLILIYATQKSYAQPRKGDWMVGANIANSNAGLRAGSAHLNINLNPSGGYFLSNRVVVGTSVGLNYSKYANNFSSYGGSIKPFARYYFSKKEGMQPKKLYLFGEASAGIGVGSSRFNNNNGVTERHTNTSFLSSAGLGLSYFIIPNVSVEGTFNMNYNSSLNNQPITSDNIYPTLGIGFQIYLPGRKKVRAQEE